MQISSGTISLFAFVALAMAGAFGGAFALKNPDQLKAIAKTALEQAQPILKVPAAKGNAGRDEDERGEPGTVTLRAQSNGHFETEAEVNGRPIEVMVDTGATMVALTYEDAEAAGIYLTDDDYKHAVSTANGRAKVAVIDIKSIRIGDIEVRNVQGAVSEPGKLHRTLLGMSFLNRLSRVDMRNNSLVLHE